MLNGLAPGGRVDDDDGGALAGAAARLRLTEGQLYTYVIGVTLALVAAAGALVPAANHRDGVTRDPASGTAAPAVRGPASGGQTPTPATVPDDGRRPAAPAARPPGRAAAPPVTGGAAQPPVSPPGGSADGQLLLRAAVGPPGAPEGVAVADDGSVWVGTNNGRTRGDAGPSRLFRYAPGGQLLQTLVVSGQTEARDLGVTGLAVDRDGALLALDGATGRVLRFDAAGEQSTVATLPDLPPCGALVLALVCEPGTADSAPLPRAIAVDGAGSTYVTDAGQATIWRIPPGVGVPQPWHQSPTYRGAEALAGVAVDEQGGVLFVAGAVRRLPVDQTGRPGTSEELAPLAETDGPAGLSVGAGGTAYVALARAGRILVLPGGAGVPGLAGATAIEHDLLDAPVGVASSGDSVFVTNQSSQRDRQALLALSVR